MLNDGGNNKYPLLVEALPPSTAMNVNLNGIMDSPLPVAMAAGIAAVSVSEGNTLAYERNMPNTLALYA